jgi:hypothetical protein
MATRRRGREPRFDGPTARNVDPELDPAAEMLILRKLAQALQEELDCVRRRLRELAARATVH